MSASVRFCGAGKRRNPRQHRRRQDQVRGGRRPGGADLENLVRLLDVHLEPGIVPAPAVVLTVLLLLGLPRLGEPEVDSEVVDGLCAVLLHADARPPARLLELEVVLLGDPLVHQRRLGQARVARVLLLAQLLLDLALGTLLVEALELLLRKGGRRREVRGQRVSVVPTSPRSVRQGKGQPRRAREDAPLPPAAGSRLAWPPPRQTCRPSSPSRPS